MVTQTVNLRKSRRPLETTNVDQIAMLQEQRQDLEDRLDMLDSIVDAMQESPAYAKVVDLSVRKLKKLNTEIINLWHADPVQFSILQAELRGRYQERIEIIRQHSDLLKEKEEKRTQLQKVGLMLEALLHRIVNE